MIYLIASPAFEKTGDGRRDFKYYTILKIGYTSDERLEEEGNSRYYVYLTENPTRKVIATIPGGTQEHETVLHRYFSKYKKFGKEWFEDVDEIYDFFDKHKTSESLDYLLPPKKEKEPSFNEILRDFIDNEASEDLDFLEEFYSLLSFRDRLRHLCKKGKSLTPETIKHLGDFGEYYEVLGSDRCRAHGYQRSKVAREYNNLPIVDMLKERIYKTFIVGQRYMKSEIKSTLGKIYKELGYEANPKASDLEKYFVLSDKSKD